MLFRRGPFTGLLFLALTLTACSRAPEPALGEPGEVAPQFGTQHEDIGRSMLASRRTGAIYVSGSLNRAFDDSRQDSDAFLHRYNRDGTLAWKKTFNSADYEDVTSFEEDPQGNLIVALGKDSGSFFGTSKLIKYSRTGQELWSRALDGVRVVFSLNMTSTGEFYLVTDDSNFREFVRKYSKDGKLLWAKRLGKSEFAGPSATDAKGNLYVADYNSIIYKFDPNGKLIWTRTPPKGTADRVYIQDIVIDRDALLLTGSKEWILDDSEYNYDSEFDAYIAKYNLGSAHLWNRSFGTKEFDNGVRVDVDNQRNVYVVARLGSPTKPPFVLRKYTPAGQLLKEVAIAQNIKGPNNDVYDVAMYSANEFYFTGQTSRDLGAGYKGGYYDAFLLRFNGDGKQVWVR